MKRLHLRIIALSLLPIVSVSAQQNIAPGVNQSDWDAIQNQVASSSGSSYQVTDIVNVDSAIGNRAVADGAITNPYGTLSGCFVFTTQEQNETASLLHGTMGVFKNGSIAWQSVPEMINAPINTMTLISAVRDLNNDGKADILTSWFSGSDAGVESLWIFSWDGHAGTLLNAVDSNNESVLVSLASGFEYVDVDGDDIYEITGDWYANPSDEQTTNIVYSWNGSLYGGWPNPPQPLPSGFYPRDRVDPKINVIVKNIGGRFSYSYILRSMPLSKQMINTFVLVTSPDSITNGANPTDWDFGGIPSKALGWVAPPGFDVFIKAGSADSSFYFETSRLPAIVQSLVRGDNGTWSSIFGDSVEYTLDQWLDEAKSNSRNETTVGPRDPQSIIIPQNFFDTLIGYTTQSRSLGWIKDQATADKYSGYFASAKTSLQQNNTAATRSMLRRVLQDVNIDSTNNLTSEAYALIRYNTEYLLAQLPSSQPGFIVRLISSTGTRLTTGSLQYYEGSWKDATNNNDGTFSITTTAKTLSLRMTYEYGTQTKPNVAVGPDTAVFQTVNVQVQLKNSQGSLIDTGEVQYYAGAWRALGTTTNGTATKELLQNTYSFRMAYAGGSNDKQQDIGANPTVVFQTVNTTVQLKNSQGNLIDTGTVQYYAGAWRSFGTTTGGVTTNELLANNYSFRMTYEGVANDKQQDISANSTVVFSTVLCAVTVTNSQNQPVDGIQASYYSGAWRQIGPTVSGEVTKELLPANLTFRITYGTSHQDKTQNLSASNAVEFNIP